MTAASPAPASVLLGNRWLRREEPFPHFVAHDVFTAAFHARLEAAFRSLLARGLSDRPEPGRFSRNMPCSDAYGWNFPPAIEGPLAFFYSRGWYELLVELTGIAATADVNGALHHHQVASVDGFVHRDLNVGWFSTQKRPDGINPMDLARCAYLAGGRRAPGVRTRRVIRALTMIYYVANPPWRPGDGGETTLYRVGDQPVGRPSTRLPPRNNTILVFENTPSSWHGFLSNRYDTRSSIILWLHRTERDARTRWPSVSID